MELSALRIEVSMARGKNDSVDDHFKSSLPSVEHLRARAKRRMPGFAFDYLTAGCFSDINIKRNTSDIREVQLEPRYLGDFKGADQKTELFGETYDAPFGVAPVGLQGLMWPNACEYLAQAAHDHNVPFVLSTVGTASIERIADITEGKLWFQLYNPAEDDLREKLITRCEEAGVKTLVLLADTPTFAYRPKEIRNGLSIPPQMTLRNVVQMCLHPTWSFSQLFAGAPEFQTMKPYIPDGLSMKHLGLFMNKTFSGRLNEERLKPIRDRWKGKLVIKGIVNTADAELAIKLGLDGMIVSNHGGRQLDSGESTIKPLPKIAEIAKGKATVMMDSGIQAGPDIANALASGAEFTFLGRTPMYGVCALGEHGGHHVFTMLKRQLQQVMEQLGCEKLEDLPEHLIEA